MSQRPTREITGQWMGQSNGDPAATIVIDLDEIGERAVGVAYLFPSDGSLPSSFAKLDIENNLVTMSMECSAVHFDSSRGSIPSLSALREAYPDSDLPNTVKINIEPKSENSLRVEWKTEIGSYGSGLLTKSEPNVRSNLACEPLVEDWDSFQWYVSEILEDGFVFRGQSERWPMQTSFHRTNRRDLTRYLNEDVPQLHRALTGRIKHLFDLEKPVELGAFMNLAQHHGFPTTLLDWTHSPFIAAYFAFNGPLQDRKDDRVRVLAFDRRSFCRDFPQLQHLTFTRPHLSFLEALSIENDRSIPQQGLLTLTNLTDIEAFIDVLEQQTGETYLYALDIPHSEVAKAKKNLRLMGISRAALFPGIESICHDLRERLYQ